MSLRHVLFALALPAVSAMQLKRQGSPQLVRPASVIVARSDAASLPVMSLRGGEYPLNQQIAAELVGTFILLIAVRSSPKFPEMFTKPVQCVVLGTLGTLYDAHIRPNLPRSARRALSHVRVRPLRAARLAVV
jgi:hypothetical protein